jgi:D-alanyl-D-alanine carboxypeptidase (penicillin-binding protein 4)
MESLERAGIERSPAARVVREVKEYPLPDNYKVLHVETSPPLDSIVYWFLKKSINLYGEALMKTFAAVQKKEATTANGLEELHDFWKPLGLSDAELNMVDGSGLSPANRVTTRSLVKVLQYAKSRDWFPGFYQSLPEYNGMKMKSGTIGNVKAFCGYHKSKAGQEYIFAIIVNNYNGSSSAIVQKYIRCWMG